MSRSLKKGPHHNAFDVPPKYYALNTVSDYPETSQVVFKLKRFEENLIEFEAVEHNRRITKTYSFPKDIIHSFRSVCSASMTTGSSRGTAPRRED